MTAAPRPRRLRALSPVIAAVLLVGTLAILLASHPEQLRAALAEVRKLPAWAPAAAFALVLVQRACQGLRLWAVVPRRLALGAGAVVADWAAGEWVNMFAPARGGDALKIVLIRRRQGEDPAALPAATGAVLADKVVDSVSIVLLCAAGGVLGLLWPRAGAAWYLPAGVALVLALALLALRLNSERWVRSRRWLADLAGGFAALKDPGRFAIGLGFALAAWVSEGVALWLLCRGLGLVLAPSQVLVALVALNLAIGVPIALANLGIYEAALAAGLSQVGVPLPAAIAIATVHHGIQLVALNLGAAGLSLRTPTARR